MTLEKDSLVRCIYGSGWCYQLRKRERVVMVKRGGAWSSDLLGEDFLGMPNGTHRVVLESDYDSLLAAVNDFLKSDMEYDDLKALRDFVAALNGEASL